MKDEYSGPDRRKSMDPDAKDVLTTITHSLRVLEERMSGKMDKLDQKVDSLDQKVEQRLVDHRKMADLQYGHLDAILEQRRQDDLQQHKDLIAAFDRQARLYVDRYMDNLGVVNSRVDSLEEEQSNIKKRLAEVEKAPDRKDADNWRKVQGIAIGLAATAVTAAAITWMTGAISSQIDSAKTLNPTTTQNTEEPK